MRRTNNKTAGALLPAIIAATGVVTVSLALNIMVRLAEAAPHVGDIVAFTATATPAADDGTRLLVHRTDRFGCVLDLNVLRHSGGSLVLESQVDPGAGTFRVHWAGPRTSDEPGNCGNGADLIVDRLDLDVLSLSAGGYGVGPKPASPFFTSEFDIAN